MIFIAFQEFPDRFRSLDRSKSSENLLKYIQNFQGSSTHGFAHAEIQNSIFNWKILELVGDIGIILTYFESLFYSSLLSF